MKTVMTMTLPSEGDSEDGDDNDPLKMIVKMVVKTVLSREGGREEGDQNGLTQWR